MASNRLTNSLRQKIAAKIFNATTLPNQLMTNTNALKKIYKNWFISKLPKDFKQATKSFPKEWFHQANRIEITRGMSTYNPNIEEIEKYNYTDSVYFEDPVSVPYSFRCPSFKKTDLDKLPELLPLLAERVILLKAEKDTKKELETTLNAYTTVTKLIKDFPEFAKHCPDAPTTSYPIAVNPDKVVHALMKVGFDITVKPVKTTVVKAKTKKVKKVI